MGTFTRTGLLPGSSYLPAASAVCELAGLKALRLAALLSDPWIPLGVASRLSSALSRLSWLSWAVLSWTPCASDLSEPRGG